MNERDYIERAVDELSMRIEKHRETISKSEVQTRRSLIDPMLEALGWDTADPAYVLLEYHATEMKEMNQDRSKALFNAHKRVKNMKSVDYALLNSVGKPVAVVEAKKLDGDLGRKTEGQMLRYAQLSRVGYGAITDGNRWKFYDIQNGTDMPSDKRQIFNVSIRHPNRRNCVDALMKLQRSRLLSGEGPEEALPKAAHWS